MSSRIREWSRLILFTGSAQLIVQAVGFVGGILVIRMLPMHEYALYTLANTMLGTMTILADGGIASGVMALGGKVWRDKARLGAVIETGMALRRKFAIFSILISIPVLLYLLNKHGASWLMSVLIVLSIIPAFLSSLSGSLLDVPLKLHQDVRPLQRLQIRANLGRLLLLALTMFVFPFAAIAIACGGVAQGWSNFQLRKISTSYTDRPRSVDSNIEKNLLSVVKRSMPGAIYFSISSQLSIWLLSIFGSSSAIAHVGALSRVSAVLAVVGMVFNILAVPRFARSSQNANVLLYQYLLYQAALLLVLAILWLISSSFGNEILWVLGDSYDGLEKELVIAVLASIFGVVSSATNRLNASRNYIWKPYVFYPIILLTQIVLISNLSFTTVYEALVLSLATNIIAYLLNVFYGVYRVRLADSG